MAARILIAGLLGLLALALLTWWLAGRHTARVEAGHPPQGRFLDIGGTRVHARVMGDGPDLVLIHGASGNIRDMTFSLAPRLAERYRVILIDRPGLGFTDPLDPDRNGIFAQADLLMRAARALGAESPVVMGHSYGGAVALAWALEHPEAISALVLVSAPSIPWTSPPSLFYRITASRPGGALAVPLISAFTPRYVVEEAVAAIFTPQDAPEGYFDHVGAGLSLRPATLRANADQRVSLLDEVRQMAPRYGEIDMPVELVHGTADTTVGYDIHSARLVGRIAGATLTGLPGIGHMPHHADEDAVTAAIDRAAERAGLR